MIEDYAFGRMVIDGTTYRKDVKIIGGAVVSDWWRDEGHRVKESDIADILESNPDILVLGKGQPGQMESTPSLRRLLEIENIELVEQDTAQALQTFNRLNGEGRKVAAGFHLTC